MNPITFLSIHCDDETEIRARPSIYTPIATIVSLGIGPEIFLTPKARERLIEVLSVAPSPNPSERVEIDSERPF